MAEIKTETLTQELVVFPREIQAFREACNESDNVFLTHYDDSMRAMIKYKYPHDLYFLGQNFLHFKRKHNIY